MINKKAVSIIIILCGLFIIGCGKQTQKQTIAVEPDTDNQEIAAKALQHAQEMQLAAIKAQNENAVLKARIDTLTKELEAFKSEVETDKAKPIEQVDPNDWQQKYIKLQADNEELRKLVQYERGLREDLFKKVEKDQITINELERRLEEFNKQ